MFHIFEGDARYMFVSDNAKAEIWVFLLGRGYCGLNSFTDEFDLVIGHFNSIQVEVTLFQVMRPDDDGWTAVCQGVC